MILRTGNQLTFAMKMMMIHVADDENGSEPPPDGEKDPAIYEPTLEEGLRKSREK